MTPHCATCTCPDDGVPQPSTSSPGIRRMALDACRAAIADARRRHQESAKGGRR